MRLYSCHCSCRHQSVMYWKAFLCLCLGWVYVNPQCIQRDRRIINGHSLPTDVSHPANVSLKKWSTDDLQFRHFCGGIVVHVMWVLTAAHCFPSRALPVPMKLQVENVDSYHVEELVLYPRQGGRKATADLALLRTLQIIQGILAVLPPPGYKPRGECQVCGLGTLNPHKHVFPTTLHCATVPVVQNAVCQQALGPYISLQPGMMCAGGGDADACVGDSGSSLLCQSTDKEGQVLAGVVSWGRGCALNGVPGIYTDITVYRKWFLSTISGSVQSASVVVEEGTPSTYIHVLGSAK